MKRKILNSIVFVISLTGCSLNKEVIDYSIDNNYKNKIVNKDEKIAFVGNEIAITTIIAIWPNPNSTFKAPNKDFQTKIIAAPLVKDGIYNITLKILCFILIFETKNEIIKLDIIDSGT